MTQKKVLIMECFDSLAVDDDDFSDAASAYATPVPGGSVTPGLAGFQSPRGLGTPYTSEMRQELDGAGIPIFSIVT